MRVDEQTKGELEIFDGPTPEATALCDLFDNTRSEGGRYSLRRLFMTPPSGATGIELRRDALMHIMEHYDRWAAIEALCRGAVPDQVGRYVDVNLATVSSAGFPVLHFRSLWWRLFEADSYYTVHIGAGRMQSLLFSIRRFLTEIGPGPHPGELEIHLTALRELSSGPLSNFTDARLTRARRIRLDHLTRGPNADLVRRAVGAVFELDALISIAYAAYEHDMSFAHLIQDEGRDAVVRILAEGLRNPFVEACVPLDFSIPATTRVVILTGPNMAGKTTFLQSLGIAVYLAHLGLPVPARRFALSAFGSLFTSMGPTEDVRSGESYFFREVRRIREVGEAVAGGGGVLALFDELFRGTNVKDAEDASRAVMDLFCRVRGSLFVVSSHLLEVAESFADREAVLFYRLEADFEDETVRYRYRLEPGISSQRLGMYLLERENLGRLFVEETAGED